MAIKFEIPSNVDSFTTVDHTVTGTFTLDGYQINPSGAITNQVLKYNGSVFVAADEAGSGGMNIGSTVTGGTAKSLLFVDASGLLSQNNTNLFFDYSTLRLQTYELGAISVSDPLRLGTSVASVVNIGSATIPTHILGLFTIDGYEIDPAGASTNQVLQYNGTKFVAATVAGTGTITGSITANQVAYGSGTDAIQGSSGLTYNGTTLTVAQHISVDGYLIDVSTGAISGQALAYDGYAFVASTIISSVSSVSNSDGTLTISPTTGAVIASLALNHVNTWSAKQTFNSHINIDGYDIDLSAGALTNQVLQYNGTKFVAATANGSTPEEYSWTLKNYYDNLATGKAAGSANEVHGSMFYFTTAATITGTNFYWGDTQSKTIRVKLWAATGATQLATVDVAVSGAGWYTATFSSSYSASAYTAYVTSYWETGGTLSWKFNMRGATGTIANNLDIWPGVNNSTPPTIQAGAHFYWMAWNLWSTGDVAPTSGAGSEKYAIEPIFTVP